MSRPKQYLIKKYASYQTSDWGILRFYMEKYGLSASEALKLILRKFASADPRLDVDALEKFLKSKAFREELAEYDEELLEQHGKNSKLTVEAIREAKEKRRAK